MNRYGIAGCIAVLLSVSLPDAAVFTVAKDGTGQYSSIQTAVNAAGPGDEIIILDKAVYNEQVTIDSSRSGLHISSQGGDARSAPVILFRDTVHVHPKNSTEARSESTIDYYMNGALRIVGAHDVIIEKLCIDGGAPFVFGYDMVWEAAGQTWPLEHGNAALCMVSAGNAVIRNCSIRNAFFGVYFFDLNRGGIYSIPTLSDGNPLVTGEVAQPLATGNNCIEYCRLHDNSFGLVFENNSDMGSTVRYNLFYENHHHDNVFSSMVKSLTSEGNNLPGGAIYFKNDLLCPMAIYNNTFWHNLFTFIGVWKAGGQHLIFNNIYSSPYVYFSRDETFGGSGHLDMMKSYANRMHNCVIAAQQQAPSANYIAITNDFSTPKEQGDITTKPFPASAEIRYLETKFLSVDTGSVDFLVPDWNDSLVKMYVVDQGWTASGVKDADGSRADLGAIPRGGLQLQPVTLVRPAEPVVVSGNEALLSFFVNTAGGSVMTDAKATLFGIVRNLDTSDVFGSAYKAIAASNINMVTLDSYNVIVGGKNTITLPQTTIASLYAFFEMIVEGKDAEGKPYTSAVGFLPYRQNEWYIRVEVLDKGRSELVHRARLGDTLALRIEVLKSSDGTALDRKIERFAIGTMSGCVLASPDGSPIDTIAGGVTGVTTVEAVLTAVPRGGRENVVAYGSSDGTDAVSSYSWFQGCSDDIAVFENLSPVTYTRPSPIATAGRCRVEVIDCRGRVIRRFENVNPAAIRSVVSSGHGSSVGLGILRVTDLSTGKKHVEKYIDFRTEGTRMSPANR